MHMLAYWFLTELVNSKITFNRNYNKKFKLLVMMVINLGILAYQLNNYLTEKKPNLFESFALDRTNFTHEDLVNAAQAYREYRTREVITGEEYQIVMAKIRSFKSEAKARFYDVTGEVYTQSKDSENSTERKVLKDLTSRILASTGMFYMTIFILFCVIMASNQNSVTKTVSLLCLAFLYLEIQLKQKVEWQAVLDDNIPMAVGLATFEKVEIIHAIFQFCTSCTVSFARVLVDADIRFRQDDKVKYFKDINENIISASRKIIAWEPTDKLDRDMKTIKREAKEEQEQEVKPKKKGFKFMYVILGLGALYILKNYFSSSE